VVRAKGVREREHGEARLGDSVPQSIRISFSVHTPDWRTGAQGSRAPIRDGGGPIRQWQVFADLCWPATGAAARTRPLLERSVAAARAYPAAGIGGGLQSARGERGR